MLHKELPRDRRFVNDSCPGVSIIKRPGILYFCEPSYTDHQEQRVQNSNTETHLIKDQGLLSNSIDREVSGTNLLSDTSSLSFLNIRLTNLS